MTKLINQLILVFESVFIMLPITAMLFLLGIPLAFRQLLTIPNKHNLIIAMITFLASMATISTWVIFIRGINNISIIDKHYWFWWIFILVGFLIAILALIVPGFVSLPPYSKGWWFYDQFSMFSLGTPLLLPIIHVWVINLYRNCST